MLEAEVTLTPTALSTVHSLTTVAPWLEKKSWVRSVGYLGVNDIRTHLDPFNRVVRGEAFESSGNLYINHYPRTFLATDTVYVKAMKPAYNACASAPRSFGTVSAVTTANGLWTFTVGSTTGLLVGDIVTVTGFSPSAFNGVSVVNTVPSGTTFTVTDAQVSLLPVVTFGTVSATTYQNGLTLETDVVPCNLEWAGWASIVEAWRRYGQILETGAKTRMISTRAEAAAMFTDKTKDNCRWPLLTFRPLTFGGPSAYGGLRPSYRASTA
jgi:hypothetical protein